MKLSIRFGGKALTWAQSKQKMFVRTYLQRHLTIVAILDPSHLCDLHCDMRYDYFGNVHLLLFAYPLSVVGKKSNEICNAFVNSKSSAHTLARQIYLEIDLIWGFLGQLVFPKFVICSKKIQQLMGFP